MGGSSGQQPVTQQTTQTKDPWVSAQPHLQNVMGQAANLIGSDAGYQPYTGTTTAPLNSDIQTSMAWSRDLAGSEPFGSAGLNAARGLMGDFVSNYGMTPSLNATETGLAGTAGMFGDIYNRALGNENPFLENIINTNNRRIGDRINASMSGAGRYGSGQHTDVMARALAESADPLLAQDYANRQQLQMGAAQNMGTIFGRMADIYGQGANRAGDAARLIPTLDAARYASADRMAGVGDVQRTYDQATLDAALKLYNAQQARPWEQLARYNAMVQGAGGLGGTQITTSPGAIQPSTTQRLLGGALAGAGLGSIVPGIGTGIGAAGGGLLGLLS